jgi:hypothetical protein
VYTVTISLIIQENPKVLPPGIVTAAETQPMRIQNYVFPRLRGNATFVANQAISRQNVNGMTNPNTNGQSISTKIKKILEITVQTKHNQVQSKQQLPSLSPQLQLPMLCQHGLGQIFNFIKL